MAARLAHYAVDQKNGTPKFADKIVSKFGVPRFTNLGVFGHFWCSIFFVHRVPSSPLRI